MIFDPNLRTQWLDHDLGDTRRKPHNTMIAEIYRISYAVDRVLGRFMGVVILACRTLFSVVITITPYSLTVLDKGTTIVFSP